MASQQITRHFIGRQRELEVFKRWFTDPDTPWILYFYDALKEKEKKGGVGKTWLLRECALLSKQLRPETTIVIIDFFNIADRDGIAVAERIVETLEDAYPQWHARTFKGTLAKYRGAANPEYKESTEGRIELFKALKSDLNRLDQQLADEQRSLLVIYDTFELIEQNPAIAILNFSGTFPDNYQFNRMGVVIASRNDLDWSHRNWRGREKEVLLVALAPFSRQETIDYLQAESIYSIHAQPEQAVALYERTEGRPILVGLVADALNHRMMTVNQLIAVPQPEFESYLVSQINRLENPLNWVILFMAHIYHRFNETLLSRLVERPSLKDYLSPKEYQEMIRTLPTLSFVRRSGSSDDFVLHDEMRRLVNQYCWEEQDPDRHLRGELSQLALDYYDELINHEQNEEKRQSYIVEMLFHKAFINLDQGFHFFDQHFYRAINLSLRAFARSLFQEIHQFENRMSLEQIRRLKLAEARLLREEESPEAALHIYEELEYDTDWAEEHRGELLYEKGECYMLMSQFPKAIASLEAWRQREQSRKDMSRYARSLLNLGYIYRRLARYGDAMRFYEACERVLRNLDDQQLYATVLNDMGNVCRFQGKIDEALSLCKHALLIRREQFGQGKASELEVGLSLSTLGHIYHNKKNVIEEERAYREAFDIFKRVGSRRHIAATHNRLGRLYLVQGELEKALPEFQQAYDIAQGINREAEIESLNQQGKVFLKTGKWEEASYNFEQAMQRCQQVQDSFHESENLLYLAEAYDHLGKPTQELMKEAKRIAYRIDHKFLLGLANRIQGDMNHRKHDYPATFRNYRVACKYMALYSPEEFSDILGRLVDLLFDSEMPKNVLPGITDSMLEYWYDLGLDKVYPQIPRICARMHIVL